MSFGWYVFIATIVIAFIMVALVIGDIAEQREAELQNELFLDIKYSASTEDCEKIKRTVDFFQDEIAKIRPVESNQYDIDWYQLRLDAWHEVAMEKHCYKPGDVELEIESYKFSKQFMPLPADPNSNWTWDNELERCIDGWVSVIIPTKLVLDPDNRTQCMRAEFAEEWGFQVIEE